MTVTEKMRHACKEYHRIKNEISALNKELKKWDTTIKTITDGNDTDYGTWLVTYGTRKSPFFDMERLCADYGITNLEQYRNAPTHPMSVDAK